MKTWTTTMAAAGMLLAANTASAQLLAAKDGPVAYGHHHLRVASVAAQKKFWVDALGGTPRPFGRGELVRFPNVLILMQEVAPTGGTKGTTVNHIGFQVPDLKATLAKVRAAGFAIVTREEAPPTLEVKDDLAYVADQKTYVAFVMAPDGIKVELVENRAATAPVANHHVHFSTTQVDEMKAWYVKTFAARPGKRGSFEAADLPGVNLTFSPSPAPVTGTKERGVDHIGFEVKNLEAFCKQLESQGVKFDRPFARVEALQIAIAFFTDPWGTYIELTEGLDKY